MVIGGGGGTGVSEGPRVTAVIVSFNTRDHLLRCVASLQAHVSLPLQIVACVRRGVASGELAVGEQLPPAAELAGALSVDRNTVLAAYRQLRDDGVLEFRRGRGARVASAVTEPVPVTEAALPVDPQRVRHPLEPGDP